MADKVARALASGLPSMTRKMRVLLPKDAPWRDDLKDEAGLFPFGTHDDQVDALVFAAWFVNEMPDWRAPKVLPEKSETDEIDEYVDKEHRRRNGRGGGRYGGRYGRRDSWSRVGRR